MPGESKMKEVKTSEYKICLHCLPIVGKTIAERCAAAKPASEKEVLLMIKEKLNNA